MECGVALWFRWGPRALSEPLWKSWKADPRQHWNPSGKPDELIPASVGTPLQSLGSWSRDAVMPSVPGVSFQHPGVAVCRTQRGCVQEAVVSISRRSVALNVLACVSRKQHCPCFGCWACPRDQLISPAAVERTWNISAKQGQFLALTGSIFSKKSLATILVISSTLSCGLEVCELSSCTPQLHPTPCTIRPIIYTPHPTL